MTNNRIVFMGTPEFAVPALHMLATRTDVDVALVVTQPDRPSGRGKKVAPPPVKNAAVEHSLPILQTASLRHPDVKAQIMALQPDLVVVAAFGMILGKWILELPSLGCVNLHASLLPNYRGASPISAAIAAGDATTGVTLMQMDRGLDTGAMLDAESIAIDATDTTESLTPKLAQVAAELLDRRLSDLLAGKITPVPQTGAATETRQLRKDDGRIDWTQPADVIERHVRAMWNWPRAWTTLPNDDRMQVHGASVVSGLDVPPGQIDVAAHDVTIGTAQGVLRLDRIQLPGGNPLEGHALHQKLARFDGLLVENGDR